MGTKAIKVAIDGAKNIVSEEILAILEERGFSLESISLFDDSQYYGDALEFNGQEITIRDRKELSKEKVDILFHLDRQSPIARQDDGAHVARLTISNQLHFDKKKKAPYVIVPEVNAELMEKAVAHGVVYSPSPLAIGLAAALKPLHEKFNCIRLSGVSFEPVSQMDEIGIDLLSAQVKQLLSGYKLENESEAKQLAFNVLPRCESPFIDAHLGSVANDELMLQHEIAALLPDVTRTTIMRTTVPIFFGLGISVFAEFDEEFEIKTIQEILRNEPGIMVLDEEVRSPVTLREVIGSDAVVTGRFRKDPSVDSGLVFWVALDNIRKGAATNIIQIAEIAVRDYLF